MIKIVPLPVRSLVPSAVCVSEARVVRCYVVSQWNSLVQAIKKSAPDNRQHILMTIGYRLN